MKKFIGILLVFFVIVISCKTPAKVISANDKPVLNDTIKIANDELEYEVIIIDPGFSGWFNSYAKPRQFYSQQYMEARNRMWVTEWNIRALQPQRYSPNLYEMQIDYQNNIDYGYEVNYMLYNYLTYFQIVNNVKLGGFAARI